MKDMVQQYGFSYSRQRGLAFGGLLSGLLLISGLLAALSAAVLYFVCNGPQGVNMLMGVPEQWLFVTTHLLAGYGMGVLLWAVVGQPKVSGSRRNWWQCSAVIAVVAYHLSAAVGCSPLAFAGIDELMLVLWVLKTLLCLFIIYDFLVLEDSLHEAGIAMLIACVSNCPYYLPGGWAVTQWMVFNITFALLAIELFCRAWQLYMPRRRYYRKQTTQKGAYIQNGTKVVVK